MAKTWQVGNRHCAIVPLKTAWINDLQWVGLKRGMFAASPGSVLVERLLARLSETLPVSCAIANGAGAQYDAGCHPFFGCLYV